MSTRWLTSIIATCLFFLSASTALSQTSLETRIKRIIEDSALESDQTAVEAVSVNHGKTLASINADYPLNPASCAKIVTAATALSMLGPNYRFRTAFYTDNKSPDGTLGNLYVVGYGDPSLVSEQMLQIVYDLKSRGVKSISGDIVVDDSFFDGPWYPKKNGDDGRAFTAPTSAFSLNFNSAKFIIAPGTRAGRKAEVTTDPPTPYVRIIDKVLTGGRFKAHITSNGASDDSETFVVTGAIPTHAEPQEFYRRVTNPSVYAGSALKEMLAQNGIEVVGNVRLGPLPAGAILVMRAESKPLSEVLRDMNKFSNNFIAEQLTKYLGAVKIGVPGSTAKGVKVIEAYLASIGIKNGTFTLENGSGLSVASRLTASQLVRILSTLYRNHALQPYFIESLSILGVDGTMKRWRGEPQLHGWLRAKTGSLANVSALAGYVPMQNGEVAAFAILANGFKKGKYSAHDAELMIASAISEVNR